MQMIRFRNRWSTLIAILMTLTALSCADYPAGAEKANQPIVADLTFDAAEDTVLTLAADAGVLTQLDGADPTTWTVASTGTLATTGPQGCEDCEKGSVEMSSDGSFSYAPAADFEGNDYLYINVASDTGGEGEYIILFEVAGSNDPPRAGDDSATTEEDAAVTISPLENDADIDLDDTFALKSVGEPDHGSATADVETGEVAYSPAANYFGEDRFTYIIADAAGVEATATISVTVNPVNDAPTAVADDYSSDEDTALTVNAADGVLGNDSDLEDDAFEVAAGTLASAQGGSVEMQADGSFSYTPAANYHGDDSFVYEVADTNDASAQGTVTLTVAPVNDPPIAGGDSYAAQEDAALSVTVAQGVLNNDSDVEGGDLTVVAGTISSEHGSVNMAADGSFSYQPDSDFFGTDRFEYNVSDGDNGLSRGTVTLTVTGEQDAPVAVDDAAAVSEGGQVTIEVLANDRDVDGDPLTVTAATNGTHGSVVIDASRTVTYTPEDDFEGEDSFTYTISDGQAESTAEVRMTVSNVNDPPTAVDDEAETEEEKAVLIRVTRNDEDSDPGDSLTVTDARGAANGSLEISANGRNVTYTPDDDFVGTDTFTYEVEDSGGATDSAEVTVTVNNIAPVAEDDVFDNELTGNVLDNDSDGKTFTPGVTLSVTNVRYDGDDDDRDRDYVPGSTIQLDCGNLTYSEDGAMTYTRTSNFCSETFTLRYTIEDSAGAEDTGRVDWTIDAFTIVLLASPPTHQTDEDEAFSVNAGAGALAEAGSPWSVSTTVAVETRFGGSATVSGNGAFSYTPPPHFNGTDSFGFSATDNGSPEATADGQIVVTVAPVNDAPLAQADRYAVSSGSAINVPATRGLLHNDLDLEGSTLTVTAVDDDALSGTVNVQSDGAFSYTAAPGAVDNESFSYTVSDGSASRTVAVTLAIGSGSTPLALADSYAITEDTPLTVGGSGVRANDSDGISASASGTSRFGGSVSMNAGGGFSYTPPPHFNGVDSFAYQLSDGTQTDNGLVRVTVSAAADAPLAGDDFFQAGRNTPLGIGAATGVLANDNDADGDTLTVTTTGSITTDEGGSAEIAADGSFTYIPPTDFTGTDRFDYTMNDGNGLSDAATVIVTVSP